MIEETSQPTPVERRPRWRLTTRHMMIAVAGVAFLFGGAIGLIRLGKRGLYSAQQGIESATAGFIDHNRQVANSINSPWPEPVVDEDAQGSLVKPGTRANQRRGALPSRAATGGPAGKTR